MPDFINLFLYSHNIKKDKYNSSAGCLYCFFLIKRGTKCPLIFTAETKMYQSHGYIYIYIYNPKWATIFVRSSWATNQYPQLCRPPKPCLSLVSSSGPSPPSTQSIGPLFGPIIFSYVIYIYTILFPLAQLP